MLGHFEPVLEAGVVLEELAPEYPRLLDARGRQGETNLLLHVNAPKKALAN